MHSSKLKDLQEQRNKLTTDMRSLLEKPDFNDEDQVKFERMESDESKLHQQIEQLQRISDKLDEIAEREAAAKEQPQPIGPDTPLADIRKAETQNEEIDQNRCFRAWALGKNADRRDVEYAREVGYPLQSEVELRADRGTTKNGGPLPAPRTIAEVEERAALIQKRALGTTPTTAGGHTVPDEMMRAIDIALLQYGTIRASSTIMPTSTGAPLPWPTTNDTANKGEILDENTQVNEQDVVFGQIVFGAFKYSSKLVRVSYELLQDSATNIPALLGRLLGERIGRIHADHFTVGVGTTEPYGIVTEATDSGVTNASLATLTWGEMLDLEHSVDPAYRGAGSGWMMADATFKLVKQIKDGQDRPLWQPSLISGAPDTFDGFPIYINQSMPSGASSKAILFGQLDKYVIRDVMGFTLIRLDERYADFAQVGFLAWSRNDGRLIDAGTNPVKFLTMAAT